MSNSNLSSLYNTLEHMQRMRMIIPRKVLFSYKMSSPTKKMHVRANRENHPTDLERISVPPSSDFCKIIIGWEFRENSFRLHLPRQSVLHDWYWLKATGPKLQGLPKHSAPIHVWIFENGANVNKTTLMFSKKIHGHFPSINHRQSVNT